MDTGICEGLDPMQQGPLKRGVSGNQAPPDHLISSSPDGRAPIAFGLNAQAIGEAFHREWSLGGIDSTLLV